MEKVIKDLKKLGFKNPIRVQNLKTGDYFYLTPKGDMYRTVVSRCDGGTNQMNIKAVELRTNNSVDLNLGKGIWVDRSKDPDSYYKKIKPNFNNCMTEILNYFESQNWSIVDSKGLVVMREKIQSDFKFHKAGKNNSVGKANSFLTKILKDQV